MSLPRTTLITLVLFAPAAHGQALLRGPRQAPPPDQTVSPANPSAGVPIAVNTDPDPKAALRSASLIVVEAPKPKTFEVHDLVTIIINESSKQSSQQKLDTKKDSKFQGTLEQFPDPSALFGDAQLTNGDSDPIVQVGLNSNQKWKGDAKYERNDRFTDKISAEIIEVKPNGVLVLEARRTVTKDDEVQTVVLAGTCRREDVTNANTILSNQLADMTLSMKNEGELRQSNKPGWITRVFRTIFDF